MATYTEPLRPLEFLIDYHPHLSLEKVTIAANSGAMVAGRVLAKVTSSGKYVAYDNASGTAGIGTADAILMYDVADSSSDQTVVVIERLAAVKSALLGWGSNDSTGITAGTADLLAKNIKVRT